MQIVKRGEKVKKGQRFIHDLDGKVYQVCVPRDERTPGEGCFLFTNGRVIDECAEAPECNPPRLGSGYVFKAVFRNGEHLTKEDVK